MLEKVKNWAF